MMESNTEAADNEEIDLIPSLALDQEENTVNSDRDSAESDVDERGEKIDSSPVKPTFKSILQAKKRLQAYSFAKVAKKPTKDEKNDEPEKSDKNTPKKPRKSQPLDRAKAVMEEIEEIKRQELRDEMVKQELIAATVKLIEANRRSRSRSSSPDRDRQFKRREIKSRNYRRTDSSGRKSASPEDRRRSRRSQPGPVYPKNWAEYQQQNLTVRKDIELKAKLFPEKKLRHYEAFKKCHNFSTPSPIIESFKYSTLNSDMKEAPRCFLRYTKACPNIPYNVNFKTIKESCMSRSQLFSIIPYDKRQTLEKFFSLSRPQATSKKLKTREWYSKSWKSKTDADCKILENSVGLSFLQNYSDQEDEENETEEIVICSSTRSKSDRVERAPSEEPVVSVDISSPTMSQSQTYSPIFEEVRERSPSPMASVDEVMSPNIVEDKTEFDSLSYSSQIEEKSSERFSPDMIVKEMEVVEDCDVDNKNSSGNFTPDNTDFHNKNRDEFEETKFDIELEELELPKRPEDVKEKSIKTKKKKKDKKADKADNMAEKSTKSKRKKKVKRKRSTSTSEESVSSSDKDKKRKKSRKGKLKKKTAKKSPVKKKRKNKKENKVKKKKVDSDKESDEKPKKKRKRADSSSESDEKKHSTKKPKRSKKAKKSAKDSESNEEVQRNCLIEDKKDDNEWEDIEEIDQNNKPPSSKKAKNNYIIPVIEIDNLEENLRTSSEAKSFEIELNIDKKYLQRTKSINEPQEKTEPTLSDNILCLPKTIDVKNEPEWEYTPDRSDNFVEDEEPNVNKLPTFNSWESDDEEFETRKTDVAETAVLTKSSSEELDFEMPLNIKPFKKRDVADYDIFKENNKEVRQTEEISETELGDESPIIEQCEVPKLTKRGRWDRRDSVQKTPTVKSLVNVEPEVTTKEVITPINPIKTAVLENEYEEFMKALTVAESIDSTKNSSNSSSAVGFADTDIKNFKTDLSTLVKDEKSSDTVLILPKDVPLIPIPAEVKPIPVPSPKVKIEETTLPLVDIPPSPKFTVDPDLRVKATIDLVSPKKEKNRLNTEQSRKISLDNLVSSTGAENQYLQELASISLPPCEDVPVEAKSAIPPDDVSSASEAAPEKKDKPFVFVGMTLSSKRVLLDKSKVNLDDSDDEDIKTKSLLKLQELESVVGTDVKEEKSLESSVKVGTSVLKISSKDLHCEQTEQISSESKPVRETILRSGSPKQGRHSPPRNRRGSPHRRRDVSPRRYGSPRRRTPDRRYSSKSNTSPRRKREYSPRKRSVSPRRRSISPRRRSVSPRRRGVSPRRKRSTSPRRRGGSPSRRRSVTPKRRQEPPRKRIVLSPRRSVSPRERRSMSPRRKRIHSPRERMDMSPSGKRRRSKSPDHFSHTDLNRPKSPPPIASPLQGPKRSVADSTISDDLLPQPNSNFEEHSDSPVSSYHHHHHRPSKALGSPKRLPLDGRLNEVLGLKPEPKTPVSSTYNAYAYQQEQYHQSGPNSNVYGGGMPKSKGSFVQVGNMVQIVPSELPIKMDIPTPQVPTRQALNVRNAPSDTVHHEKSKIVQVGNMLQIVPTTMPAQVIANTMPEIKKEIVPEEEEKVVCDKSPIEIPIKLKTAESRAEKEKRRKERELRRAEKERKRKEREKKKQVKLKQRTEDMIKRALQLEVEDQEEEEAFDETPMQWPPLPVTPSTSKEVGKSILVQAGVRRDSNKADKRKIVQFADGVKPGEGTSPSGGEELMSPPPSKKLPKEKRYKKTKLFKTQKKKVKVKIIKKLPKIEDSDEEDDDLPPPSPPPGSPPPHIFPPRVKLHALNNVRQFLPNLAPPSHQSQQPQPQHVTFTPPPPINVLMGHPSAIHQAPLPMPSSPAMVVGAPHHHVPITSVPPPIHHGAQAAAVPTLLHHGSVPAVVQPMHQATVAMHHGLPHHTGPPPTGTHGLSHPHASFHF